MSAAQARALKLKPLGYFIDYVVTGVPEGVMGIGPVSAVRELLRRNTLQLQDDDDVCPGVDVEWNARLGVG